MQSQTNINSFILPLQFALSAFVNMSLMIILITLFANMIKFIKTFKGRITGLKNEFKYMLTKVRNEKTVYLKQALIMFFLAVCSFFVGEYLVKYLLVNILQFL